MAINLRNIGGRLVTPDEYQGCKEDTTWNDGGHFTWGHWKEDKNGEWLMPLYTSGSDYSNSSLVEVSNFEVLKEAAEAATVEGEPAFYVTFYGGYGTFGIAFHVERTPEDIREMLAGLDNYPLLDEQHHSQLETDKSNEAWNDWGRSDYRKELNKKFHGECDTESPLADKYLDRHFYYWMEKANVYWENDGADTMYIDLERIVKTALGPPKGFRHD